MQYPSISLILFLFPSFLPPPPIPPPLSHFSLCEGAFVKCVKGAEGELGRIRIQSVNATK